MLAGLTARPALLWRQFALPWYQRLQRREQRLLLVTAVVLPLLIFVFGLWLPMNDSVHALRAALPGLQSELAEARQLADRVASGGGVKKPRGDLLSQIDAAARGSNVRGFITRIKPQPMSSGQVALVQLRKAPYADTVRFLGRMAELGIASQRARISDVEGNGLVDVDITFSSS